MLTMVPTWKMSSGFGFVDRGIVLGGKKYLFIAGQSFFERTHARLAAHHERSHHVGKDDHVPNGHHGQFLALEFFLGVRQLWSPVSGRVGYSVKTSA